MHNLIRTKHVNFVDVLREQIQAYVSQRINADTITLCEKKTS